MSNRTPLEVARRLLAAFEAGDTAAVDELIHPAHRDHDKGVSTGRAGVRASIRSLSAVFAEIEMVPEDLIAAGDRVVARARFSSTHIGEMIGLPPAGE